MLAKISVAFILILAVASDYPLIHEQVKKQGGLDFVYDSHVESTSDSKLKIVNSITNNGSMPLAVKWAKAGISCKAFRQLQPGSTESNSSIAQQPYILDHAPILYGNAFQYSEDARCYVDGQVQPKNFAQTVRRRENAAGDEQFKIVVTSRLGDDRRTAKLTLRVEGEGFSLILPTRLGEEFEKFGVPKGRQDWRINTPKSLRDVDIQEESEAEMVKWLNSTPQFKNSNSSAEFVVLRNKLGGDNEISFPINGSDWELQTVYIVAYTPDKSGFVGLAAEIHLPR
jgi:hypothetical protein